MARDARITAYIKLLLTVAFWGGAFVATKFVVAEVSNELGAFLRVFIATVCLIPYILKNARLPKHGLIQVVLLGILGMGIFNLCFFQGLSHTTSINAGIINAFSPAIITLLSLVFLKEEMKARHILGFLIALSGVFVIISKGSITSFSSLRLNIGDLYIFLAVVSWGVYSVLAKGMAAKYGAVIITAYSCLFAAVFLFFPLVPSLGLQLFAHLTYKGVISLIYLGAIASALGFVWWADGIQTIGAGNAAMFQNFNPIFAAFFAMIILGEKLYIYHVVGGILVIAGFLVSNNIISKLSKLASSSNNSKMKIGT